MSFGRPDVERLLSQIPCVGFSPREAHREPEQRFVMLTHNLFEVIG